MTARFAQRLSGAVGLVAVGALCVAVSAANARPARCFASDEGHYACDFRSTGSDGSFEMSAPGKPTYSVTVDRPGSGFGFMKLGGRSIALPGRYKRSTTEPGCWVSDATGAKICAH